MPKFIDQLLHQPKVMRAELERHARGSLCNLGQRFIRDCLDLARIQNNSGKGTPSDFEREDRERPPDVLNQMSELAGDRPQGILLKVCDLCPLL